VTDTEVELEVKLDAFEADVALDEAEDEAPALELPTPLPPADTDT
jgi:hypothetical protein